MKVSATGSATPGGGARPARGGGEGFRLAGPEVAATTSQTSSVSGVGGVIGVGALLALQEVGSPLERRRRSVRRASRLLDELDGLKIALLGGAFDHADLDRLARAVRDHRDATDDPKLESVLDEIETRAMVELAKLERAPKAC